MDNIDSKPPLPATTPFVEAVTSLVQPRWKESDVEFKKHFDLSYDDFCMMATVMSEKFPDKMSRYEKIREMEEEAAILWLIKHGKSYGILKED
jgi:hypothetical protein